MKLIAGIRKLLGTPERIAIVWLIAGVLLLAWVVLQDAFYIRNPIGYYYMLGFPLLLALQHLLASALRMFAERIARKPLRAAASYYQNANALLEQSELDLAVAEYDLIIRIDPDNARAYTGRGRTYDLKGEHDLAIADYTAAIRIDPFIRGLAHRKSLGGDAGDYDLAWAQYYRGCSYLSKGEADLAKRDFDSATLLGHAGFPKALGNAGLLKAHSYNTPAMAHHHRSEDAVAVHYVKPCRAVRMNEGENFRYSKFYVGVSCKTCLENIPNHKFLGAPFGSPMSRFIFPCLLLVSPLPGWLFIENLVEGRIFPWLGFPFLMVFAFLPLWADELAAFMMTIAKPLATKFLAKPFYGIQ